MVVAVVEGAAAADEADFQAAVGVVAVAVVAAARRKAGAEAMVTTADAAPATFRAPSARPTG